MKLRNGASKWSLAGVLIGILAIIIGFLAWSAVNKPQSLDNYAKGSASYTTTIAPVNNAYPLGCSRFQILPDGRAVDLDRKVKK